jgi:sulfate adenylyltransferase subunit 1
VIEQTKRHSFIASLLQISHIIVCVNKMDLVNYDETVFNEIVEDYEEISSKMMIKDVRYIPISALNGDNVVERSINMPWYQNAPLLHCLETIHISSDTNKVDARFPIQTVLRPQSIEFPDFRGFAGRIGGGIFRVGDEITALPSGLTSTIETINKCDELVDEAFVGMSVVFTLEDEIDISRGDMLVKSNNIPNVSQDITAMICWLHTTPAKPKAKYIIKHTTNEQKAIIKEVIYKIDVNTLKRNTADKELTMNAIGKIQLRVTRPLLFDSYATNRNTGSFILIDPVTNDTVAAGMIV